jgi:hypothetical protein
VKIITVSGAGSGAGKTALAVFLLSRYKGYAAIKVSASGFFTRVTDSPEVIEEEGKDTALMKTAGASHVVWVQCPSEDINETLPMAMNLVGDVPGVVIEGNSPLKALRPDTAYFVIGEGGEMKPGADEALSKADVVVVNADAASAELIKKIREFNPKADITTFEALRSSLAPLP